MGIGILVGLADSFGRPVGAAEGPDPPRCHVFIQRLDDRPHRNGRIIAMEQVQVHVVGSESGERIVHVGRDVERRHPPAVRIVVRPLGQDDDLVPDAPGLDPLAEHALTFTTTVDVGGIEAVASQRVDGVKKL